MSRILRKKKKVLITILAIFLIIVYLVYFYQLLIGSLVIRTRSEDYCNFEGFKGYSNLEIFPSNPIELGEIYEYYYLSADTLMNPTCKVFMECKFLDDEKFEDECHRLSQVHVQKGKEKNDVKYSEDTFNHPAYVAMYDWNSCYEYALILEEEKKIIYVFLQGNFVKVDKEYRVVNADSMESDFSIYASGVGFEMKYR